ncbi:alanine racemase, partial [Jatrophihabitans sp.]|uniref:alanine racemase n=1 Tax=Jatrophihabitans sp. TaxID=1932789 RepID=UPI0030C75525|nr:alanine racemase [Jatrophihabitans sp.]
LDGGAGWLGTAIIDEALALRAAGIAVPTLAWLWTPGEAESVRQAVAADIDLSVSSPWQLAAVRAAAESLGQVARVHLKIDTGLSRNGSTADDWLALVEEVARTEAVQAVGVWSHFAYADEPGHPTIARQLTRFTTAVAEAEAVGLRPQVRHIANSAATLTLPSAHFDLVRPGVAIYGLSPVPSAGSFGLTPAMTLRAGLASVKRVRAGEGVSYGHNYTTSKETTLALVPLGYADGVPRAGTNVGPVSINGQRFTVSGRVCMDQIVVDVGDLPVSTDDHAVLFGSGHDGEPLAQDWADAVGTIHYEIVTRIGPRVARTYVGGDA